MLTVDDAITRVRTITGLDTSQQVTDDMLEAIVDMEYKRVRRELSTIAPTLYNDVEDYNNSTTGVLAKPADFFSLVELEHVLADGRLVPLIVGNGVNKGPAGTGNFRLTYVKLSTSSTDLEVPDGLEDVIIQRAAAQAQIRRKQDPAPHKAIADEVWGSQLRSLRRRYGRNVQDGLREVKDVPFCYLERGNDLVVVEIPTWR